MKKFLDRQLADARGETYQPCCYYVMFMGDFNVEEDLWTYLNNTHFVLELMTRTCGLLEPDHLPTDQPYALPVSLLQAAAARHGTRGPVGPPGPGVFYTFIAFRVFLII